MSQFSQSSFLKRRRTNSFSQSQPYVHVSSSTALARPVGRSIKGSYSAAKGTPKSYRVRAPAGLKKVVKAIIEQQKEQKIDVFNLYSGVVTPVIATSSLSDPSFEALAPVLPQGNKNGERIGSDVRLTKSFVKFQLSVNQEASDTNGPFIATVWIGRVRGLASAAPSLADFTSLLMTQTANTFSGAYTNNPLTGLLPVNDDLWDIKVRKDYKLGKSGRTDSSTNCNNDFNMCYVDQIDITRMFPRKLIYSGADSVVEEENLFFWVTYRTLNGSTPSAGVPNVCAMVSHRYTDA